MFRAAKATGYVTLAFCFIRTDQRRYQGLETLGLFRQYRFSESPSKINGLIDLYLATLRPFTDKASDQQASAHSNSLFTEYKSAAEAFAAELAYAHVHDIAALLKWVRFSTILKGRQR